MICDNCNDFKIDALLIRGRILCKECLKKMNTQ